MPIVFVAVLRKLGITKPHVDYEAGSPLKRIETNASSAPMMPTVSCLSSLSTTLTLLDQQFYYSIH